MRRARTHEEDVAAFWSKVDKSGECWIWNGSLQRGYGQAQFGGKPKRAHRVAYELQVGPIPDGLALDHLCHVKSCVRPSHLEPVTLSENTQRAHRDGLIQGGPRRRREGEPEVLGRIRGEAARRGLRTKDVAALMGVSVATWRKRMNGTLPMTDALIDQLAVALRIDRNILSPLPPKPQCPSTAVLNMCETFARCALDEGHGGQHSASVQWGAASSLRSAS